MKRVLDDIAVIFPRVGWRRPGRRSLAVSGWRAAVWAVVIVVAPTLVTPPAAAQNSSAWLNPTSPEVLESAGKVVLTVTMWRAGRVAYRTYDGHCSVNFLSAGTPPADCADNEKARAPEDYTATSGELVFSEGGEKTITIPIVDDGVAEGNEAFTVAAWEEANADPFLWDRRGDSAIVRIKDDEVGSSGGNSAAPAARSSANTTPAGGQSSGSAPGVGAAATVDPATPTTATPPAGELLAGPGSELASEGASEPVPDRSGGGGGSISGLVIGLATAALAVIAFAVMRRRRRWSSAKQA